MPDSSNPSITFGMGSRYRSPPTRIGAPNSGAGCRVNEATVALKVRKPRFDERFMSELLVDRIEDCLPVRHASLRQVLLDALGIGSTWLEQRQRKDFGRENCALGGTLLGMVSVAAE